MIDTSVGIESVTWYQTDGADRRRIHVAFQDELHKEALGGTGKLPGEIELFGDDPDHSLGRMSLDSPDSLDQLARAITVAAQHWRHCIEECDCFKGEPEEEGPKILSFGNMSFDSLFGVSEPDDDEEDDDPRV